MGIYLVMKNNLKRSLRHRTLFLITFLLPVALCIIAGSIKFGKASVRVGILGLEDERLEAAVGNAVYEVLSRSEGIKYASAKEASLNTDLMTGEYQVILDYRGSNSAGSFKLRSYQKQDKAAMLKRMFEEALSKKEPVRLTGLKPAGLSVTERSIALLITMFLIFSTVHASMLIRDKQSGTLLRYHYAKNNRNGYAAGFFLHNLLITYLQILLSMTALLILQKGFVLTPLEILISSVTMAVISSGFAILICLGSKSEVQSNITASALAAVMSLLGGTFVAVEAMPGLLKLFSFASPVRWIVELIRIL